MRAKEDKIRLLCISGVVAAIIYIFTAFFHIPSHTGYTHVETPHQQQISRNIHGAADDQEDHGPSGIAHGS